MKSGKKVLLLMAIAFSVFMGYNMYCSENKSLPLDVSYLNIEALASGESSTDCVYDGNGCYSDGTWWSVKKERY